MISRTLTPEIDVTKIEIQNESTEIKNSYNKCLTSVKIREILKKENAEEHENNADIINIINVDTAVPNVQEHGINAAVTNVYRMEKGDRNFRKPGQGDHESKNPVIFPKHYWVQINIRSNMPEDSSPLDYESSRNGFVALVFSLTFIMLLVTAVFIGVVYFVDDLREFFIQHMLYILIIGSIGLLMVSYAMVCSTCARMLPCNIVLLVLTVIFMSMLAATITAHYRIDLIFIAFIITTITVFVCLLLALTSFDFTSWLLYVIGISVAFSALALVVFIMSVTTGAHYKPIYLAVLVVGTILNIIFFIIELQMILGGKNVELSEDDWALGAFMLYTSIIEMFINMMQLLNQLEGN